jgi:starch synthase
MRVMVGSPGRFHTFDLARELERGGRLLRLFTGYPKWKVDGLPSGRVKSFPWLLAPAMLMGRLGLESFQRRLNRAAIESFDRWMAARLEDCDVFHSLSSFGVASHRAARQRFGALTVCDRGSSHILFQDELLAEEFARWGAHYTPTDRRICERELQEYEECDRIVLPSSFALQTFLARGVPAAKLRKVSYGVDLRLFRPVPKEDDVFRVLYAGALSLRKGIPYLCEALAGLRLLKFEVWLIGHLQPEVRPFLEKYRNSFRHLGAVPRTQLYSYYSQASVLVQPSLEEGLSLVLAQAMACGVPVIATTNTGASDLLTDGAEGFIVGIRDPAAIREKVLYLYEHPERREEMARAALERVKRLGGWTHYGDQMVGVYSQALAERDRGAGARA